MKYIVKIGLITTIAVLMLLVIGGTVLAAGPDNRAATGLGSGICPVGASDASAACLTVTGKLTGLTVQEIQTERQTGKSLVQIAAAHGVDENTLVNAILNTRTVVLKNAVAAGTITQAQADLMLRNMEQNIRQMVERTEIGPASQTVTRGMESRRGMTSGWDDNGCGTSGEGLGPGLMNRWAVK
jgi:hypothetical protein